MHLSDAAARAVGNCASVIYFMTVGIHGVKFEHDRLNHSQVPWKLRNLCRRILFFPRNLLVAEYSRIEFLGIPLKVSVIFIQQSFVISQSYGSSILNTAV